jgi:hypothetical protein
MAHPVGILPEAVGLEADRLARLTERGAPADELEQVGDLDCGVDVADGRDRTLGDARFKDRR